MVKIHSSLQDIECRQETTPTPILTPILSGSAPKTICSPHLNGGDDINILSAHKCAHLKFLHIDIVKIHYCAKCQLCTCMR